MQATQPTTPIASPEVRTPDAQRLAFQHAQMVSGDIVNRLAVLPFAVETHEDFPSGWRIHLKFRSSQTAGLLDFARLVGVPVTEAVTEFGTHVECLTRMGDVELRASALLSHDEADALKEQSPTVCLIDGQGGLLSWPTSPDAESAPVPLGESPVAQDQADQVERYDQSLTRYVASLGGSVVGHVPAAETDDGPSTISFAPVSPAAGGEQ
ncbi:hypothetical protein [Streptomyces sp. NBC_01314]|uniref:hypothetical protein n=1 Tax=Streptomyces sp. NBC_01314 TaxID=2903821 RepID=UPI003091F778|nr:hypothetical protein OG622_28340 [Streptomyces sp. NBC_01314]